MVPHPVSCRSNTTRTRGDIKVRKVRKTRNCTRKLEKIACLRTHVACSSDKCFFRMFSGCTCTRVMFIRLTNLCQCRGLYIFGGLYLLRSQTCVSTDHSTYLAALLALLTRDHKPVSVQNTLHIWRPWPAEITNLCQYRTLYIFGGLVGPADSRSQTCVSAKHSTYLAALTCWDHKPVSVQNTLHIWRPWPAEITNLCQYRTLYIFGGLVGPADSRSQTCVSAKHSTYLAALLALLTRDHKPVSVQNTLHIWRPWPAEITNLCQYRTLYIFGGLDLLRSQTCVSTEHSTYLAALTCWDHKPVSVQNTLHIWRPWPAEITNLCQYRTLYIFGGLDLLRSQTCVSTEHSTYLAALLALLTRDHKPVSVQSTLHIWRPCWPCWLEITNLCQYRALYIFGGLDLLRSQTCVSAEHSTYLAALTFWDHKPVSVQSTLHIWWPWPAEITNLCQCKALYIFGGLVGPADSRSQTCVSTEHSTYLVALTCWDHKPVSVQSTLHIWRPWPSEITNLCQCRALYIFGGLDLLRSQTCVSAKHSTYLAALLALLTRDHKPVSVQNTLHIWWPWPAEITNLCQCRALHIFGGFDPAKIKNLCQNSTLHIWRPCWPCWLEITNLCQCKALYIFGGLVGPADSRSQTCVSTEHSTYLVAFTCWDRKLVSVQNTLHIWRPLPAEIVNLCQYSTLHIWWPWPADWRSQTCVSAEQSTYLAALTYWLEITNLCQCRALYIFGRLDGPSHALALLTGDGPLLVPGELLLRGRVFP